MVGLSQVLGVVLFASAAILKLKVFILIDNLQRAFIKSAYKKLETVSQCSNSSAFMYVIRRRVKLSQIWCREKSHTAK